MIISDLAAAEPLDPLDPLELLDPLVPRDPLEALEAEELREDDDDEDDDVPELESAPESDADLLAGRDDDLRVGLADSLLSSAVLASLAVADSVSVSVLETVSSLTAFSSLEALSSGISGVLRGALEGVLGLPAFSFSDMVAYYMQCSAVNAIQRSGDRPTSHGLGLGHSHDHGRDRMLSTRVGASLCNPLRYGLRLQSALISLDERRGLA